jgi:hypothetical protein
MTGFNEDSVIFIVNSGDHMLRTKQSSLSFRFLKSGPIFSVKYFVWKQEFFGFVASILT